ncbi:outer membrane lipoprotein-sorting protein [Pseudomaricurvus alkylphenolicus]|uniref:outer membrane lipoprotein-sorting protein n=1 Tax=Pseudomaricurvus alkylphenolicus TaxID=1306991 RepID=UPI00142285F4|nr:outer membrane lipoprotein-sorting protein [Pseudomaricurvus alkylphenolicus]NIB45104.1 outer membrane lipoprotein-sorting protein [Pseudomaricurvus alkylphenolicus]
MVRTQSFEDIREMGGQLLPTTVRLIPADKPNESTVMVYEQMAFDVDMPDKTFSLQSLRRR